MAATVDHGLRPEAAAEAALVAGICAELGIPHQTLTVTLSPGNLQAQARTARYAALAGWMEREELAQLATAHHADDQAETLILRLNRGSGVAGLAGVRAKGRLPDTELAVVRPLLGWRRNELTAVVTACGLMAAQDPSNADDRFDRARLRKALAGADWLDPTMLAASARHLADADTAIDWAATREWQEAVAPAPMGLTYRPRAPKAVALRVIARILSELGEADVRGSAIARLYDSLRNGQPASLGALVVRSLPDGWHFGKTARPRRIA